MPPTPPISIDGSSGGIIPDQAGSNIINLGTNPATVVASQGTDTVIGSDGPTLVDASGNPNPLLLQAGLGADSVFSATGSFDVISADGSQIISFSGPPDHFFLITTDYATVVTTISDGSGADTIMGGSLTYTIPSATWTPPTPPPPGTYTTGGGTDTTGGGTDTTGGGTDTTGGGTGTNRKSTRLNSSHWTLSRMPSSA